MVNTFVPGEALRQSGLCDEMDCHPLDEAPDRQPSASGHPSPSSTSKFVYDKWPLGLLLSALVAMTVFGIVFELSRQRIHIKYTQID